MSDHNAELREKQALEPASRNKLGNGTVAFTPNPVSGDTIQISDTPRWDKLKASGKAHYMCGKLARDLERELTTARQREKEQFDRALAAEDDVATLNQIVDDLKDRLYAANSAMRKALLAAAENADARNQWREVADELAGALVFYGGDAPFVERILEKFRKLKGKE